MSWGEAAAAGINATNGLIGNFFALGMNNRNNEEAAKRAEADRRENYYYNEMAANNADARTRALYSDLYSPQAQMQQLKDAGLSPSMMAGGLSPGAGGASGAQGAGSAGIQTPYFGLDPLSGAQMAKIMAETDLIKAKTNTENGDNERGRADIKKIWEEAGALNAYQKLETAQSEWQNLQNEIVNDTKEEQKDRIKWDARAMADKATSAYWEAEQKGLEFRRDLATFENDVKIRAQELANMVTSNKMAKAQTELIQKEIEYYYENASAHWLTAEAYREWVDATCENLPQQIELRKKELDVDKWRIGVGAFTECVRTIGYMAGAAQLGADTTTEQIDEHYNPNGSSKGYSKKSTTTKKTPHSPIRIR